ncbi:MAG: OmpH family outer membrane protein [Patescibacteria group bacterium]
MSKKKLLLTIVTAIVIFTAILAFVASGASKSSANPMTAESIGIVDTAQVYEKLNDYIRIKDLRKAYDGELNNYTTYQRQVLASYVTELEQKKQEEEKGKTDAEKQEINRKYETLARDKATEIQQLIQAKMKELQDKLSAEMAKADERLRQVIAAVGEDKGLQLVLAKSFAGSGAVVYYGGTDVTADVIAKGNEPPKK